MVVQIRNYKNGGKQMKKLLLNTMFALTLGSISLFADDAVKKEAPKKEDSKSEGPKLKVEDISVEGKIFKSGDDYMIKTDTRDAIILPKEKDAKVNYDEWIGKRAVVSGKGTIYRYQNNAKSGEKRNFVSVESIKAPEPKEEKKEEKKEEPKKDEMK